MTSRAPQLLITLSPQGKLVCELPGQQATRRQIELRTSDAGETLLRILEGQAREGIEIGLDGAPTAAQVRHWERHATWPSSACRFCIAEGRAQPDHASHRKQRFLRVERRTDGVEIRVKKIPERACGHTTLTKNIGDLGL